MATEMDIRHRLSSVGLPPDLLEASVAFFALLHEHYASSPPDCGYRQIDPQHIRQGRRVLDELRALPVDQRPAGLFS